MDDLEDWKAYLNIGNKQWQLEVVRFFWQTLEGQTPQLLGETYQRFLTDWRPYIDPDDEEELAVYIRDLTEEGVVHVARATALIQAWIIFEDVALLVNDRFHRGGRESCVMQSSETLPTWAERILAHDDRKLFERLDNPQPIPHWPLCSSNDRKLFERLDNLRRLRNILVHSNGYVSRMKPHEQQWLQRLAASASGLRVEENRLHFDASFVETALEDVFFVIWLLGNRVRFR